MSQSVGSRTQNEMVPSILTPMLNIEAGVTAFVLPVGIIVLSLAQQTFAD